MNRAYPQVRIGSVFGSLRSGQIPLPSARPDFRIAPTERSEFEAFVALARENGIETEYAANAMFHQSIEETARNEKKIIERFRYLQSVGITRVIVSDPLLMEIVSDHTDLKIKVSTIVGVNKPYALKHFSRYNVDNLCPDIYINRNLPLLAALQREGEKYAIQMELLANEVCFYGDVPCSNVLRTACYQHSSMGGNPFGAFNNWPFQRCQAARAKNPVCWLKIPYILPQHMKAYRAKTGISRFKISGRTNAEDYLFAIAEKYMSQQFEGEIKNLFMLPQNSVPSDRAGLTVEELERAGFFSHWFQEGAVCNYNCHECHYCEKVYEGIRPE